MKFETEINFQSNTWNRDAWARIQADLNPEKESICYTTGTILGVTPGQAVKELCGFETFLCTRLMPAAEDGSIRRLNKEVIFYTDPRVGQRIIRQNGACLRNDALLCLRKGSGKSRTDIGKLYGHLE